MFPLGQMKNLFSLISELRKVILWQINFVFQNFLLGDCIQQLKLIILIKLFVTYLFQKSFKLPLSFYVIILTVITSLFCVLAESIVGKMTDTDMRFYLGPNFLGSNFQDRIFWDRIFRDRIFLAPYIYILISSCI